MNKCELLHTVPIFSDLNKNDIAKISDKMISRTYDKGQIILMEEDLGETFFVMASGSVKITRLSDDGREVILAILGEGDFFGEMSLLDGVGRSANVISLELSEVLTLSRNDFLYILETYPKIAISLLEELTMRLRKSDQQIENLSLSDVEHRIGMTLVRLSEELGKIKNGTVRIQHFPYQQDIANMAGTSRETVSRTLTLFQEKGMIDKDGRTLIIIDYSAFCRAFS